LALRERAQIPPQFAKLLTASRLTSTVNSCTPRRASGAAGAGSNPTGGTVIYTDQGAQSGSAGGNDSASPSSASI